MEHDFSTKDANQVKRSKSLFGNKNTLSNFKLSIFLFEQVARFQKNKAMPLKGHLHYLYFQFEIIMSNIICPEMLVNLNMTSTSHKNIH